MVEAMAINNKELEFYRKRQKEGRKLPGDAIIRPLNFKYISWSFGNS
jgi:hypothetical protein